MSVTSGLAMYTELSERSGDAGIKTPSVLTSGFRFLWGFNYYALRGLHKVMVPLWFPALLSLLATAAAWRADAKYLRRAREGACLACGYDRAGLAAGAVCPECGAAAWT